MNADEYQPVLEHTDWYTSLNVSHDGCIHPNGFSKAAIQLVHQFKSFRTEHDARVADYYKYEKQAAAEVVSKKPDLSNISSGENAGFIRRIARNVVQHTPNVFIANEFDDDSVPGVLAAHILRTKIIGDDEYSNDMQQNLITTARRGFTIGFDTVIPVLRQKSDGSWYMKYDTIHYRDVYPEPGVRDIRESNIVYVRRYLTRGDILKLIRTQAPGWDVAALKSVIKDGRAPSPKRYNDHESEKHGRNPGGYEIITYYNSFGDPFLTYEESTNLLLRIEENKHPLKEHPVMFFLPERDDQQPYGKSLLALTYGRQEFQDLFWNGAMKQFYRNLNPPVIGYGITNAMPNLSPGKYTEISNPNGKLEPFEVSSQSLMMFNQISQGNAANMVSLLGAADQQMAAQNTGGMMSQTPAGVQAQQQMVDITTNNYQKAMENFFSKYCSYALTMYFQELKGTRSITPTADVRKELINQGMDPELFLHEARTIEEEKDGVVVRTTIPADGTGLKDGQLKVSFANMAVLYNVKTVPGSLVELEDEKQLRILQQIFVPLSQSMPALAQTGDREVLSNASRAMQYIVKKTIELSGSIHSTELSDIWSGNSDRDRDLSERIEALEEALGGDRSSYVEEQEASVSVLQQMREQMQMLTEVVTTLARAQVAASGAASGAGGQPDMSGAGGPVVGPPTPRSAPA